MFVDWISIKQTHVQSLSDELLPVVYGGTFSKDVLSDIEVHSFDSHSAFEEALKNDFFSYSKLQLKSSHSSSVMIRCDGRTVELTGNVGRFERPDNLFNHSFADTFHICNKICELFGLPIFSFTKNSSIETLGKDGKVVIMRDGAQLTQLHVTKNFITGSHEDAYKMIDYLATKSVAHVKSGRVGSQTAFWGRKGGRQYLKAYVKADAMIKQAKEDQKNNIFFQKSLRYAKDAGIVRFELELDRKTIIDSDMRYISNLRETEKMIKKLFDEKLTQLIDVPRINLEEFDFDQLPKALRTTAFAYVNGANLMQFMSRRTFYDHAKKLRAYGIDITVTYYKQKDFKPTFKVIELKECPIPDWYKEHLEEHLKKPIQLKLAANN